MAAIPISAVLAGARSSRCWGEVLMDRWLVMKQMEVLGFVVGVVHLIESGERPFIGG
jgi:hypothetical protein